MDGGVKLWFASHIPHLHKESDQLVIGVLDSLFTHWIYSPIEILLESVWNIMESPSDKCVGFDVSFLGIKQLNDIYTFLLLSPDLRLITIRHSQIADPGIAHTELLLSSLNLKT